MFDPKDNIPQEWPARPRGSLWRERMSGTSMKSKRWLVRLVKFAVVEYLNSPDDFDEIVERWLKLENK